MEGQKRLTKGLTITRDIHHLKVEDYSIGELLIGVTPEEARSYGNFNSPFQEKEITGKLFRIISEPRQEFEFVVFNVERVSDGKVFPGRYSPRFKKLSEKR